MMETPSVFAAAQQGLQAEKMEEKSAMLQSYHRRCGCREFLVSRSTDRRRRRGAGRRICGPLGDDARALTDPHLAALTRE
jgi:hypothetical protein